MFVNLATKKTLSYNELKLDPDYEGVGFPADESVAGIDDLIGDRVVHAEPEPIAEGDDNPDAPAIGVNLGEEIFVPAKYARVVEIAAPAVDEYEVAESDSAELIGTTWTQKWVVRPMTSAEKKSAIVAKIDALEAQQTPRRIREAALGEQAAIDLLTSIDSQIQELRTEYAGA